MPVSMDTIVSLAKRRGFVFPSSEIYGGFGSFWDYGPLGVELKNNVKRAWWKSMVYERDDVAGLDSAIITSPEVWRVSGHVGNFSDPMVDCKMCKQRYRADDVAGTHCPSCGGEFTEARQFNLMFRTYVGPVESDASVAYLRPETAQGIFVNFANVQSTTRKKLPFGIAQIGKSFRNEITPGNFIFRTREFEQMELEYFVRPGTDEQWHDYWIARRMQWYIDLGIKQENLRLRQHCENELAHYAEGCSDVEFLFPMGWAELEGIANRTDFDLRRHTEASNKDLTYFDEETNEHIIPYVIEPSGGVDRATLAFMINAYDEEPDKDGTRVVLRFHRDIAPIKVAILPLSKKEALINVSKKIEQVMRRNFVVTYDETGSIGKRYRRQDEIGTPYCVTVDFDTLEDKAVTIRERDSMEQIRVPVAELVDVLKEKLEPAGMVKDIDW
jgi:glycyl-tRNA synthetase